MATQIRLEMNIPGMIAIMQSPAVMANLMRRGNAVKAAASARGGAYLVSSRIGKTRARVSVITADQDARKAESLDRALTRALDAARG